MLYSWTDIHVYLIYRRLIAKNFDDRIIITKEKNTVFLPSKI